jgi:hypothetical protein
MTAPAIVDGFGRHDGTEAARRAGLPSYGCGVCTPPWQPQADIPRDPLRQILVHLEQVHGIRTGVYEQSYGRWGPLCPLCEVTASDFRLVVGAVTRWRCAGCGAWMPPHGDVDG